MPFMIVQWFCLAFFLIFFSIFFLCSIPLQLFVAHAISLFYFPVFFFYFCEKFYTLSRSHCWLLQWCSFLLLLLRFYSKHSYAHNHFVCFSLFDFLLLLLFVVHYFLFQCSTSRFASAVFLFFCNIESVAVDLNGKKKKKKRKKKLLWMQRVKTIALNWKWIPRETLSLRLYVFSSSFSTCGRSPKLQKIHFM